MRLPIPAKAILCLCLSFLLVTCSKDDPKPAPVVAFTFTVGSSGFVSFSNNSLNADTYTWSFGDGNTSTEQNPTHTYETNDVFTVILNAKGAGGSGTFSGAVTINNITSTLTFNNNSFTPITITVNGLSQVIAAGGSISYTDEPGTNATVTAFTSGTTISGSQVGLKLSWSFSSVFPAKDDQATNLNVTSDYFFLKVNNNSGYAMSKVYVNYGYVDQSLDNVLIPSDGVTYSLGYYKAFSNSNVRIEGTGVFWFDSTLNLPFTNNQLYTFNAI